MSALVCDICGGNLAMDASGEFAVCESCGMKHTKERVRTKVQEIQGVVEVTKGEVEKERLLKNAETFISLNERNKANSIYHQITEDYPDDYRGWFCLAGMVRDELYDTLSTFTQTIDITLKDAESSIYEGGKIATTIIGKLKTINYYNSKVSVLNKEAANTVTMYERSLSSGSMVAHHKVTSSSGNSLARWSTPCWLAMTQAMCSLLGVPLVRKAFQANSILSPVASMGSTMSNVLSFRSGEAMYSIWTSSCRHSLSL